MSFQQKCCINPLSPIRQLNCLSPLIGFIKPLNTYLTNVAPQRSLRATERASLLVNELMSLKHVSIKVRVEIKSVDLFLYLTSDTYAAASKYNQALTSSPDKLALLIVPILKNANQ